MKIKLNITPSILTVWLIFLFCITTAHINTIWCGDTPFCWDMKQYYTYLPQFFIEHDLDFIKKEDFSLNSLPNGKHYIKYSAGLALLEAPFFFLAWLVSNIFNVSLEGGYSKIFIEFVHYGMLFYFLLGLIYLRKILKYFEFSETVISVTILTVFFGTNLFHYILGQGLMSHGFLFSLHCVFIYLIIKFYNKPNISTSLLIGLIGGLITLIRPTEVICFIVLVLWEVNSIDSFKNRIRLLISNYKFILVMIVMTFIVWIPQMIYWHHISGSFILYSYTGEKLFWEGPKILEILFSPRNGLLPYCPVIALFLLSLFIPSTNKKGKLGIIIFVVLNIYLVSCWWCWWYGGSFGARALIQIYPYLAVPFAGMLQYIYNSAKFKKYTKVSFNVIIFLMVALHLKFWYQYKHGFIHYDSMTKEAYWFVFPRVLLNGEETEKYYTLLKSPDYDMAKKGIR